MIDVSVCIVSLNAREYLRECLISLKNTIIRHSFEVIVVDNGSTDDTAEMLQTEFPETIVVQNQTNLGFTRPTNQAMCLSRGRYVLLLNPDTVTQNDAVDRLVDFLEANGEAGLCGPKILNRDGTLQTHCRRGVARPWNTISYFLGLHKLFPQSKRFGGYLLTYLDEDATAEVDSLSGACMLIRRAVIDQIGYLDERYFAYQEDSDYCFQAQKAGWKIYYYPEAQVLHYGGRGGTRVQPFRSIYEWHRSYWLFYRKNLAKDYFFLFNWLYYGLMAIKLCYSLITNFFRKEKFAGPKRG